jgi:hypothetical protein
MTKLQQVAEILFKEQWVDNITLAAIQNRFGASILLLRQGKYDGYYWDIEKRLKDDESKVWEYRLVGFLQGDETQSPKCADCGSHNVIIRDDRKVS